MRLLLVGNYGGTNIGDEALQSYFLHAFPEHDWTLVSTRGKDVAPTVPRLPYGLRGMLNASWRKTMKAIRTSDAIVFGGGALLTDSESVRSGFSWWTYLAIARACGTPYVLAFQGIGPYRSYALRRCVEWAVKKCAFISVRDEFSWKRIEAFAPPTAAMLTFDPVLILCHENPLQRSEEKILTIIPRFNTSDVFLREAVQKSQEPDFSTVDILLFQPHKKIEHAIAQSLVEQITKPVRIVEIRSIDDVRAAFSRSTFVHTQRYHGAIFSLAWNIPYRCVSLQNDDKMQSVSFDVAEQGARKEEMLISAKNGESALRAALLKIDAS